MRIAVIAIGMRLKMQLADIGASVTLGLQQPGQGGRVLRHRNSHMRYAKG
jgi:hypothetical protein